MTLPKPPANGFSAKENPGALIALKALRYDPQGPDPFGKSESGFAETTYLDVWVLADSREVGAFYSNVPNSSRLGRQFKNNLGEMFYGRIESEKVGAGTSYILAEPYPSDRPLIAVHKAQVAGEQAPSGNPGYRPPTYQNEPAWQDSPPAPQGQPAYAPQVPAQPPAYQPTQPYAPPQGQPAYAPPQAYPPSGPQAPQQPYPPAPAPQYQPQGYGAPAAPPAPPSNLPADPPF